MSKDKPAPEGKAPSKIKRRMMLIIGALVLVGTGTGVGIFLGTDILAAEAKPEENHLPKLVLKDKEKKAKPAGEGKEGEKAAPREGTVEVENDQYKPDPRKYEVVYHAIPESFTTNLVDGSGFIQTSLSLATYYDDQVIANIQHQAVPIRSAILMVLAEQDPAFLSTSQGKQRLQKQLTNAINDVLRKKEGFGGIDNVYFTTLVIQ